MKKKKLIVLILIIVIITFTFITLFKDKSYTKVYDINDYHITEEFTHEDNIYHYQIKNNNIEYEFILNSKYKGKKLITNIEKITHDQETCLIPQIEYIDVVLCSNEKELINWNLTSNEMQSKLPSNLIYTYSQNFEEYNDLKIYNHLKDNIYIWNYKGFDYISKDNIDSKNIFDSDVYDTNLITTINEYILIPNFAQEYNFNEVFLYNTNENKIEKWQLDYDISYDSYIMGTYENSVYLIDKKNKIQYELVPHKQKMRLIATENKQGLIYDGEWTKEKVSTIINEMQKFTNNSYYNYSLIDNKLYLHYNDKKNKTLISNKKIDKIVSQKEEKIIYLSENLLYFFTPIQGEILLVEKEEWLFNSENKIFLIFQ